MEKPYLIYNSGKARLTCLAGLFIVTPLVTSAIYAFSAGGSPSLPIVCGVLVGLSVFAGFCVDRRVKC
jgi:hypothetical protein